MRSWPLLAVAVAFLLAGCADEAPVPADTAAPAPQWVEASTEETRTVQSSVIVTANVCDPVTGGFFVGGTEQAKFDSPGNLTSIELEVTWTATNPTAEAFRAWIYDGDDLLTTAEGPSPLRLEVGNEAAAEVEGSLTVYLEPARCPVVPANAATAPDQPLDLKMVLRSLSQG